MSKSICAALHVLRASRCIRASGHDGVHEASDGTWWGMTGAAGGTISGGGHNCPERHPVRGSFCMRQDVHTDDHTDAYGGVWPLRFGPVSGRITEPTRAELDRIANLLIATWEHVEGGKVNVSYIATFVDLARAVIEDRRRHPAAPTEP